MEEDDIRGSKDVSDCVAAASYKAIMESGGVDAWFDRPYQQLDYTQRTLVQDRYDERVRRQAIEAEARRNKRLAEMQKARRGGKSNSFIS